MKIKPVDHGIPKQPIEHVSQRTAEHRPVAEPERKRDVALADLMDEPHGDGERQEKAAGRNIVVVVRGPDTALTVRRRDRVAGVWINHDAASLNGMPAYYYLASSRPLAQIAPPAMLARYGIGMANLQPGYGACPS